MNNTVTIVSAGDGQRLRQSLDGYNIRILTMDDVLAGASVRMARQWLIDNCERVLVEVSDELFTSAGDHWLLIRLALERMRCMPQSSIFILPIWFGDEPKGYADSELGHLRGLPLGAMQKLIDSGAI